MSSSLDQHPDRIAAFFAHKTILITGGTGFLGKVLIEKLLRCCTDLARIYLLIRTKKDKEPQQRLLETFKNPLFDTLRATKGASIFSKVVAIGGDLSSPDLALKPEDRALLCRQVEVIYHAGATIRFDADLQTAVFLNVRGTKLMLDLANECKNLAIFCHMSTAYCYLNERVLYEKTYEPPASPHHVIKTCEWMDNATLKTITDKILGDYPNTYSFTKALGEGLVSEQFDNIPAIILRPSVVVPIWKEPLPGWTDNINGPTGLLIGAGKGVLRTMYCNGSTYSDYIPVDIVANAMLCTSFDYATSKEQRVYNVTSSSEYKVTFNEVIDMGRNIVSNRIPLNWVLWYPGGSMKQFRITHYFAFFMYQLLPAIIIDAFLMILGIKPVLMRVQRRIWKGYDVLEYYANRQWDFDNSVGRKRAKNLFNAREQQIYCLSGEGVDYYEYFTDCVYAARRYILKEGDETIVTAKRHMKVMWFLDWLCKSLIVLGVLYWISSRIGLV